MSIRTYTYWFIKAHTLSRSKNIYTTFFFYYKQLLTDITSPLTIHKRQQLRSGFVLLSINYIQEFSSVIVIFFLCFLFILLVLRKNVTCNVVENITISFVTRTIFCQVRERGVQIHVTLTRVPQPTNYNIYVQRRRQKPTPAHVYK